MGIVQKYGGTSVGSIEKIKNVAKRIIDKKNEEKEIVVVVSAMGKTTDRLIDMAKEISSDPSTRELDMLMSTGEQQTIALLAMALESMGYKSVSLTGLQAGIQTSGPYTKNKIDKIESQKIQNFLSDGYIVVVAGFQGVNENGDITTLGRGGSDTTAVALAASLGFGCEIYTDVDGIYGVDPRVYPDAKKLDEISYEEMMEMASLGAGVMETRAVELGKKFNVEIYVARAHGDMPGTYIREADYMEEKLITGLSISDNVLMVSIQKVDYTAKNIAKIFSILAKNNVNVDMISQTAPFEGKVNVSFTCPSNEENFVDDALTEISKSLPSIEVSKDSNITKLSVVGIGMMNQSGVAASMFELFAENEIGFNQVTTSEISISYTIGKEDKQRAVVLIAQNFNL